MYDEADLDRLIAAMRATGTTALTVKARGKKLHLSLQKGVTPRAMPAPSPKQTVASPGIGLFRPRGMGDGLAALDPRTSVLARETLGYVAKGAALIAVSAPATGRLAGDLPKAGRLCGYGDILFTMEHAP